ncbi:hypothetical protein [Xanthomonas citri]|uniref:hypothetical protein n=1 Tax=Xanthomonas citri TaxID=346 RepID=UPI00103C212B|nr:hypothetical protein [Xanthomonas citri]
MKTFKFALTFILLITGACSAGDYNYIDIKNGGDAPLHAVEVDVGGGGYKIDLIKARHKKRIEFDPISDSGVSIEYVREGGAEKKVCSGDIYVTTGLSTHILAVIEADGTCNFEADDN